MKPPPEALEVLALRRAKLVDADKVRYRIYKTPTEFVAVIAESALLAMKAAGIKQPHKIVRDLPTDGVAIEAARMAAREESPEQVLVNPLRQEAIKAQLVADIARPLPQDQQNIENFKPLTLDDLQRAGLNRARILSPEHLSEIIDAHSKVGATPPPPPEVVEPRVVVEPDLAPPPVPEVNVAPEPAPAPPPALPELSQEEKVMQLANAILPSEKDLLPPVPINLSADEVTKLLHE